MHESSRELAGGCGSPVHLNRRSLLRMAGLSGLCWLTPLATQLARSAERSRVSARSLIMLWLEGAPSQLETFDPHPGTEIAAGSLARKTKVREIEIGFGFEQLAEQMESVSLIRAITSKEGDHERAVYNIKTGFRPDTTLLHPAIGSVICHHFNEHDSSTVDIPRHISILPGNAAARGGYLGDQYDAFKISDPVNPVPDVEAWADRKRQLQRLEDLKFADEHFRSQRRDDSSKARQFGQHNLESALRMMSSEQLSAFNVGDVPNADRLKYGDTPFGRGCLAAMRLVQAGARCVEVTLPGWDTHVDNHKLQAGQISILDPAIASLIADLKERDLLDSTMIICGGEFGRTPWVNKLGGRDHWPHGFSMAIAGGGIPGGRIVGKTSGAPKSDTNDHSTNLNESNSVENLHATIFRAFGIDSAEELMTPVGRPMKISEGKPIKKLLEG